jgi:anti-sigma regulatory factor (Ser/Thr protein kinase)
MTATYDFRPIATEAFAPNVLSLGVPAASYVCRVTRSALRETLRAHGYAAAENDALVIANELVTNAVEAGEGAVALRVTLLPEGIVIRVGDQHPHLSPVMGDADADAENGRGLLIVAALAEKCDTYERDGWKWVWAFLAAEPDGPAR